MNTICIIFKTFWNILTMTWAESNLYFLLMYELIWTEIDLMMDAFRIMFNCGPKTYKHWFYFIFLKFFMRAIVLEETILMKKMDGRWKSVSILHWRVIFKNWARMDVLVGVLTWSFLIVQLLAHFLHGGWDVTVIGTIPTVGWTTFERYSFNS